jgi:hypothetical protein
MFLHLNCCYTCFHTLISKIYAKFPKVCGVSLVSLSYLVCQQFRVLADNDICWSILCENKGWKTASSPIANPLAGSTYNTRTASRNAIRMTWNHSQSNCLPPESFPWKNMYKCKFAAQQSRSEVAVAEAPAVSSPKKRTRDHKKDEKSSKKR